MKASEKSGIKKHKQCVPCFGCLKKQLSLCKLNNTNKDRNKIIFTIDSENLDIPTHDNCDEDCPNSIENSDKK
tara:strand:+ start:197 stop:415 length:219 start_codon:yes stop_codon:yes gene_type:complete